MCMRHEVRAAFAVASLSWRGGALGFLYPAGQKPVSHARRSGGGQLAIALPSSRNTSSKSPRLMSSAAAAAAATGDDRHWMPSKRNREPIVTELSTWLEEGSGCLLEIASGTGCHVEAYAKRLPGWSFQPTEHDEVRIPDILATIEEGGYENIRPPARLDVCSDPSTWPRPGAPAGGGVDKLWDAAMCINMIHIAPQECTKGLLAGTAAGLKIGGRLFIYGPFALDGLLVPDSNKSFDESLKARSEGLWGIRDAAWVAGLADEEGLELTAMTAMPANNFFVVFTKVREAGDVSSSGDRASRVAERVSAVVVPARDALVETLAAQ